VKPPTSHYLSRRRFILVVALHDRVSPHNDFARGFAVARHIDSFFINYS
jgi:hypothetical protein